MVFAAALALLMSGVPAPSLACVTSGEAIKAAAGTFDYKGTRYSTCCGGCSPSFKKDPERALKSEALKGKLVGVFLFDATTGARLELKKAVAFSDFNGVRYPFASDDAKKAFDAEPKKFALAPAKEAVYCPVMQHGIKSVASSGGYVDHEGVRYYVCCPNCLTKAKTDIATLAPASVVQAKAPMVADVPAAKK
jgi:YHS domain-containing protein